ncbi:MAG: hypothetical protein A2V66_07060 [Ignavibacteria bacterium RBG_13_36_8]|nr:MAG: hypothetical protein A2V66_07060 [Ignavibacteria bacterium RBG_13_36_8]
MDVSVVIVNWNTKQLLMNCLQTIYDNTELIEFEIIVVDNASSDNSVEMVKQHFPQTIVLENSENLGYAAANNQGITIARGRYVLILNSDMIFIDDSISKVCSFADSHPNAAVVGCKMLNRDRTLQQNTYLFPSLLNLFLAATYLYKMFPKSKFFARERMGWWDWNDIKDVDVIVGCFILVRMDAIHEVGPMDDQFFMYYEETDWCYRFKKAGWDIIFAPVSKVIHLGGESTKKNPGKMLLQMKSSLLLYFKKHMGYISYTAACLLMFIFFSLRIPYWLVHSLVSKKTMKSDLNTAKLYMIGLRKTFHGWRGLSIKLS